MGGFAEKAGKCTVERAVGKLQTKPLVIPSTGESLAANQAGRCPANAANPRKLALAVAATIKKTTSDAASRQRQSVAGALAVDIKISAGPPPFRSVRSDAVPTSPELGH
jgi:hypothetical protein